MSQDNPDFGRQLTHLMQAQGIADAEFAEKIGISLAELIAWKSSKKMPDTRDPDIVKSLRICAEQLGQDDTFFRKAWFGGLLNIYMEAIHLGDEKLAKCVGLQKITIHRWRKGVVLPATNREKVKDSINACTRMLQLDPSQTQEFLRAAGVEQTASPTISPTPSRPTSHPAQFFGREALLRKIYTAWCRDDLQNISVLGPKASGKTSLLYYLKEIISAHSTTLRKDQPVGWEAGWLPYNFGYALVEFKDKGDWTTQTVTSALLDSLGENYVLQHLSLNEFEKRLLKHKGPVIILMDDIHEALKINELDGNFWRTLRSLAQGGKKKNLAFLTTSRQDPQEIIKSQRPDLRQEDSPFSNTFTTIQLGPLTESEAYVMLDYMNCFSETEKHWVIQESGCWPKSLQILCEEKFSSSDDSWKTEGLKLIKRLENPL